MSPFRKSAWLGCGTLLAQSSVGLLHASVGNILKCGHLPHGFESAMTRLKFAVHFIHEWIFQQEADPFRETTLCSNSANAKSLPGGSMHGYETTRAVEMVCPMS